MNLAQWNGRLRQLEKLVNTMAQLMSWSQLPSGVWQGSAIAHELILFSRQAEWSNQIFNYTYEYAGQVEEDYQYFKADYNAGKLGFNQPPLF